MKNSIIATLAYYDVLDFPLKAEEIFRYLIKLKKDKPIGDVTILEVKRNLDELLLERMLDINHGFYFLFDKSYLVPLRIKKEKNSVRKWTKTVRATNWLKFLPFVDAVFGSGSLALNNCDELSDLDVLVATKPRRIWLARFFVTGLMAILGVRRKPNQSVAPDKICLNHYITSATLEIPFENLYNAQNYINLKPLFVKIPDIRKKFYEKNSWLAGYLENFSTFKNVESFPIIKLSLISQLISGFFELILNNRFGNWLESMARDYQVKRIKKNPLTKSSRGHVVYNDKQLAFHPDSPEIQVLARYQENLSKLYL